MVPPAGVDSEPQSTIVHTVVVPSQTLASVQLRCVSPESVNPEQVVILLLSDHTQTTTPLTCVTGKVALSRPRCLRTAASSVGGNRQRSWLNIS